ncbi:MAG: hypothetical protein KDE59_21730 [Anaerolineales bacterium]|nr:hypothetical protein [Anaerolineales bacterium]
MVGRSKIGFHLGPGGNPTGIGNYMRALDRASIPFTLKSVDHYGPCFEAANLARQSGIRHNIIFRLSTAGQGQSYDFDVPPYKDPRFLNDPEGAASQHWARTKARLPQEFDKSVWIEPINEVDKNLCGWLGRFAVRIADLAHEDGCRVALFAWSSGEPERAGWEHPAMLAYLRLCAERPEQAAIALHEYGYEQADLFAEFPYRLGRFQLLFDVCDRHNIPRPTTFITEWGWTLNHVPTPELALPAIRRAAELYAPYPEIRGAALWYLGAGWSGLANKAQKLITPITQLTLTDIFPGPPTSGQAPVNPGSGTTQPTPGDHPEPEPDDGPPDLTFLADATIPPDTRLVSGQKFVKSWRVRNSGGSVWGQRYALLFKGGVAMTERTRLPLPPTEPGAEALLSLELTAPPGPGVFSGHWEAIDPAGRPFGAPLSLRILSVEAITSAQFVADITVPDDSEIAAGQLFTKTWRVRNNGTLPWDDHFTLNFVKGTPMAAQRWLNLTDLAPGAETEISLELRAPFTQGTYFCDWEFRDERGQQFGDTLFARIRVI